MGQRTNGESLTRGHASLILLPGNEHMLDRAREILAECRPYEDNEGTHLIPYHKPTHYQQKTYEIALGLLRENPDAFSEYLGTPDKYGHYLRPRTFERNGHITICISYIQMDLQSALYLVQNPTYHSPQEVNAWSTCSIPECCAIAHLDPGRPTPWYNQYGSGDGTALLQHSRGKAE